MRLGVNSDCAENILYATLSDFVDHYCRPGHRFFITPQLPDQVLMPFQKNFAEHERGDTVAVMIVSKRNADKVWPSENPVGKRLMLDYNRGKYAYEVVRVTGGVRYHGPKADPRPEVSFHTRRTPTCP